MTVALTDGSIVIAKTPATHHDARKALPGPVNHWTRTLRSYVSQAPATTAYLAALMVTTATLANSSPHAVHWLVASASTNLHNMTIDPLRVLVVSAFWVQSTPWIWPMAPLIVALLVPAERLLGTGRTLFVFAAGHVGATALTVAAIGVGVDYGLLPHRLAYALDVGPSYGLAAVGAVLATRLPRRRMRRAAIGALLLGLATAVILGGDFTDAGHLLAALIGLALSRVAIPTAHGVHEPDQSLLPNARRPRDNRKAVLRASLATGGDCPKSEADPCFGIPRRPDLKHIVLTVKAGRLTCDLKDTKMMAAERPRGVFSRQLFQGDNLDTGVLRLTLPVSEQAKPHKIEVAHNGHRNAIKS
jgi:hypothetical protein